MTFPHDAPISSNLFRGHRGDEPVVTHTNFPTLKLHKRGKVRDIYEVDDYLLIVATDRISAFDVVLPQGIPFKGKVLTQISKYWFDVTRDVISNHVVSVDVNDYPEECQPYRDVLSGRSMLVVKAQPLPVECIVRGYLYGSAWAEYREQGTVCGIPLPAGLIESAKLPEPVFTPSTKAEVGVHDENIPFERMAELIGKSLAETVRSKGLAIYARARDLAEKRGIIIADTKMEFGLKEGELILIDELLTPDSSRFWPKATYQSGRSQESFDKQYVRDYLISIQWDRKPPAPDLPADVIQTTSEKYLEALERLTGIRLA